LQVVIEGNPVSYSNKGVEKGARSRVLSPDELRAIWHALEDDEYGDIVRLLILTVNGATRSAAYDEPSSNSTTR